MRATLTKKASQVTTIVVASLASLVLAAVGVPAATAIAVAPTAQSVQVCGTPAPGHAACFAQRVVVTPGAITKRAAPSLPYGYGPTDLQAAYKLNAATGAGQTVAIVDAFDDPTAAADLAVYRKTYGLPACTVANGCFSKVNGKGVPSPLPARNAGWSVEISLDVDMVSAICPKCHILLVEAPDDSLDSLGQGVDTAVRLGAKFVSNSYGGTESADVLLDMHYNHAGVAITAATGDTGYGVQYPASSPYVTAVGGTSLKRAATTKRGWTETAWSKAGSGCSAFLKAPAVQATVTTGCNGKRAVSDVSAVADTSTPVAVYGTYGMRGWAAYGGTSAAAPIIAAIYALAGTPRATDYPNTYPYAHATLLTDITVGLNGKCAAAVQCKASAKWDGPTGLGTPNTAAAFKSTP